MQNKGHSSKNHPSMLVHVLPDYNRQFNKWESSRGTLFVKYLLFTCFCLRPLLLLQDFFIDCAGILFLFFWLSVLFALLSWTCIALNAEIIEAEKGFKQKKLRNAVGLTLVSSYYGIQYCWKCLKETL